MTATVSSRGGRCALLTLVLIGLLVGPLVGTAKGQVAVDWDAAREQVTRAELELLRERLQEQVGSTAYSARLRSEAERSIALVERRLREGDFQTGDRIVLLVEGEPDMSDTLTVRSGRLVDVPVVGALGLDGVLRSELQGVMEEHLSNYLRSPRVRTQALIRLSVIGEVGSPGFYVVPADVLVTDVLMLAGGPSRDANVTNLRVERGSARIWEGEAMELAVIQGRTLDQMNIQAGDRIVVPRGGAQRDNWERIGLVATVVGSVSAIVFAITRLF